MVGAEQGGVGGVAGVVQAPAGPSGPAADGDRLIVQGGRGVDAPSRFGYEGVAGEKVQPRELGIAFKEFLFRFAFGKELEHVVQGDILAAENGLI